LEPKQWDPETVEVYELTANASFEVGEYADAEQTVLTVPEQPIAGELAYA
jgi:hypothetical protein